MGGFLEQDSFDSNPDPDEKNVINNDVMLDNKDVEENNVRYSPSSSAVSDISYKSNSHINERESIASSTHTPSPPSNKPNKWQRLSTNDRYTEYVHMIDKGVPIVGVCAKMRLAHYTEHDIQQFLNAYQDRIHSGNTPEIIHKDIRSPMQKMKALNEEKVSKSLFSKMNPLGSPEFQANRDTVKRDVKLMFSHSNSNSNNNDINSNNTTQDIDSDGDMNSNRDTQHSISSKPQPLLGAAAAKALNNPSSSSDTQTSQLKLYCLDYRRAQNITIGLVPFRKFYDNTNRVSSSSSSSSGS